MKKIKNILLFLLLTMIFPLNAFAKETPNIYIFKGSTCTYCKRAIKFFRELKEQDAYKDKFNLVEYEVWHDDGNEKLEEKVAEKLNDKLDGVPYIVIGDTSFSGYVASDNENLKKAINDYYNAEKRNDVVGDLLKTGEFTVTESYADISSLNEETEQAASSTSSKANKKLDSYFAIAIIVVAVIGFGYIVYLSKKDSMNYAKKSIKREKEMLAKKEAKPSEEKTTSSKKTTNKKKTTTKKTTNKKTSK